MIAAKFTVMALLALAAWIFLAAEVFIPAVLS